LIVSAKYVTSSAINLSIAFGLSQTAVGLTIIALGTSLPELAVSIAAIYQKKFSIALGNVLGSNVTNITLVLGIGALLTPLDLDFFVIGTAMVFLIGSNVLLTFTLLKYNKIPKNIGLLFVLAYALFIAIEVGLMKL